jgi:hypothetical protein
VAAWYLTRHDQTHSEADPTPATTGPQAAPLPQQLGPVTITAAELGTRWPADCAGMDCWSARGGFILVLTLSGPVNLQNPRLTVTPAQGRTVSSEAWMMTFDTDGSGGLVGTPHLLFRVGDTESTVFTVDYPGEPGVVIEATLVE